MPLASAPPAAAQVQVVCQGTWLEARGSAERKRPTRQLAFSLMLEAEAADTDPALEELQRRLAAVRTALQGLGVRDLEVTSPSTWRRGEDPRRPAATIAQLSVQGALAPERLQPLVRQVGALPGVRLSPVRTEADPATNPQVRKDLLRAAYQDALRQARELAEVMGLGTPRPLQVSVEGGPQPMPMRAMAADAAPPPFDPRELPQPIDRLSLQVQFCAP
jgi:uncharacterized protein YggE